jgi:hypothetical protein
VAAVREDVDEGDADEETPGGHRSKRRAAEADEDAETEPPGTGSRHSTRAAKFSGGRVPPEIKDLLKKHLPLPKEMNHSFWRKIFLDVSSRALSLRSWKKYSSVLNLYKEFCADQQKMLTLPADWKMLSGFILWCREKRSLKASSLKSYVSTIRSLGRLVGGNACGFSPLEKLLLAGVENGQTGFAKPETAPLRFEILKKIRTRLAKKRWSFHSRLTVWSSCCIGYFGALRAGEMLAQKSLVFDRDSDLLWKDVTFPALDSVKLHLKSPKIRKPGGDWIELFEFPDERFCPVKLLRMLKEERSRTGSSDENVPVFRFKSGKNLTVSGLNHILKDLLKNSKFKGLRISARSLRSGLPSDLEDRPDLIQDPHVKCWGRWRSQAYQIYMKNDSAQRRWIFDRICQTLLEN